MPTTNPRINITLEPALMAIVTELAEEEHQSVSGFSKELIIEALERREDKLLSVIAANRDTKKAKRIKHDDVWK